MNIAQHAGITQGHVHPGAGSAKGIAAGQTDAV